MKQQIMRIDYELTGSELIALLKESEEIKIELPIFNRAQRRSLYNYGIYMNLELDGYIHLRAQKIVKDKPQPVQPWKPPKQIVKEVVKTFEEMRKERVTERLKRHAERNINLFKQVLQTDTIVLHE